MFDKLMRKIKQSMENINKDHIIDATRFNDQLALKTQWSPLKKGGANFKTHNLIKQSPMVLKFQLSLAGKLFIGVFMVLGLGLLVGGIYALFSKSGSEGILITTIGATFFAISVFMYRTMAVPVVFDRSLGVIWRGHKLPKLSGNQHNSQKLSYANDVHAIQILSERIHTDKNSYDSYELNLVMKDASRVNIIDHGNYQQLAKDAQDISVFLGKPVWDIVNHQKY
jgi:hypothetical protein